MSRSASCGILLLFLLAPAGRPSAESWQRTYGGPLSDGARSVERTSDGGLVVAGFRTVPPDTLWDVWVFRTDSSGDTIWSTTFGSPLNDHALSVHETEDGYFVVTGAWASVYGLSKYEQDAPGDIFLALLEPDGDTVWTWLYAGGNGDLYGGGNFVLEDDDGNFVIAGTRREYGYTQKHATLLKIDRFTRAVIWDSLYPADQDMQTWNTCVRKTPSDGGFFFVGLADVDDDPGEQVFLVKTDSVGAPLDVSFEPETGDYEGRHMAPTSDGGFIVTGNANPTPASGLSAFLMKVGPDGEREWVRHYPGDTLLSAGWSVAETPDSGFLFAGYEIRADTRSRDLWIVRTDANGDTLWTQALGGSAGTECGYGLDLAPYGAVAAGITADGAGGTDAYLVRVDDWVYSSIDLSPEAETPPRPSRLLAQSPAAGSAAIRLFLARATPTSLAVYDTAGRRVRSLLDARSLPLGESRILWDGDDDLGRPVPSGMYFVRFESGDEHLARKLLLIRRD